MKIFAYFSALQANFKILEKKNMKLEEENDVHKEAIILLEETVKVLEKKANMNKIEKKTIEKFLDLEHQIS